jgi:hypothetical protein
MQIHQAASRVFVPKFSPRQWEPLITHQVVGTSNPMVVFSTHYGTDGAVNIFARHLALVA